MNKRLLSALPATALAMTLAACSPPATSGTTSPAGGRASAGEPVAVATTTQLGSVLGDITECAGTSSTTLMGPGDDPHSFSASSQQVAELVKAKLVVANGLTLESGLASTLEGARADGATIYEVAPQVDPLSYAELEAKGDHADHDHADEQGHDEAEGTASPSAPAGDHADEHGHDGHDHGAEDPHVFLDAARMARAAGLIGEELTRVTGDARYTECGQQAKTKLEETDQQVKEVLAAIPEERRVMITDHEAFNYFADAYDFEVAGVVIRGGSTDAEPNSADLAKLTDVVREEKVPAIFSNNATNPRLVEAVAKETGQDVTVVQLYVGSLGPEGSDAATYSDMMLTNARRVADALK